MSKVILFDEEARKKIENGINTVAKVVGSTLGPRGRNVILDKAYGSPLITNDGVTIAKEIDLKDKFENMGAQLIKEVASKTNDIAGDGTTTATVLASIMVHEGIKNVAAGANGILLRKGIELATNNVVEQLKDMSQHIEGHEKIKQVASISANDDTIGELIATAMDKVGSSGIITVDDSQTSGCNLKFVEGLQFDKGYISPYMVTDVNSMEILYENALILLYDGKISQIKDLQTVLELSITKHQPLLIVADELEGEALTLAIVNKMRGVVDVVAVKSPGFGDRKVAMLEDIAILTGGTVISEKLGLKLENVTEDQLGKAKKIKITKDDTIIFEGAGISEEVDKRKNQIKQEIENSTSDYDKEKLNERLGKLSGGVAVIQVGAATETEQKELKLRIEDSLNSTKAAVAEGIVAGGGTALINCISKLNALIDSLTDDVKTGAVIVAKALEYPLETIAYNSGLRGEVAVETVKKSPIGVGLDAVNRQYVSMIDNGIIDPVKVTRTALQNASSIAAMVLSTNAIVAAEPEKDKENNSCELATA